MSKCLIRCLVLANSSLFWPLARPKGRFHQARRLKEHPSPNTQISKIFRPISDHFRPWLKCPETKGFATFGAKFSDLKWSEEIRAFSCKTLFHFVSLQLVTRTPEQTPMMTSLHPTDHLSHHKTYTTDTPEGTPDTTKKPFWEKRHNGKQNAEKRFRDSPTPTNRYTLTAPQAEQRPLECIGWPQLPQTYWARAWRQ